MKVAVLGNCQSRPVATFLGALCPSIEVLPEIVTHLQHEKNIDQNYEVFSEADIIFAQYVNESYRGGHLATSTLKNEFKDKVVSWPNVFFTGQCPDVVSVRSCDNTLVGPLDTYHIRPIVFAWQQSLSPVECTKSLLAGIDTFPTIAEQSKVSFAELKKRETMLDVPIADYIEEHWCDQRLFHVFNHPTNSLLIELVERMAKFADLPVVGNLLPDFWSELLNRVIVPVLPSTKQELGFQFRTSTNSKGFTLKRDGNSKLVVDSVKVLTLNEMVESFYSAYDMQLRGDDNLTFTPSYLNTGIAA